MTNKLSFHLPNVLGFSLANGGEETWRRHLKSEWQAQDESHTSRHYRVPRTNTLSNQV